MPRFFSYQAHDFLSLTANIQQVGCCLTLWFLAVASPYLQAAEPVTTSSLTPWSLSASAGEGARGQRHSAARIALQRRWQRTFWHHDWGHFTGYWDLSLAEFEASRLRSPSTDRGAARIWALALAPVLRWQFNAIGGGSVAPFMELAVGVSYLSDDKLRSGKRRSLLLGSHFQFEDRGVVGLRLGRQGRWELAYQRIHYSNFDLANDNHGVDTQMLMLGYRF